eukprot:gene3222-13241_t
MPHPIRASSSSPVADQESGASPDASSGCPMMNWAHAGEVEGKTVSASAEVKHFTFKVVCSTVLGVAIGGETMEKMEKAFEAV